MKTFLYINNVKKSELIKLHSMSKRIGRNLHGLFASHPQTVIMFLNKIRS